MGACPCTAVKMQQEVQEIEEYQTAPISVNERKKKEEGVPSSSFNKRNRCNKEKSLMSTEETTTSIVDCTSLVDPKNGSSVREKNQITIGIYGAPRTGKTTLGFQMTKHKVNKYYIPSVFSEVLKTHFNYKRKKYNLTITIPKEKDEFNCSEANCFYIMFDLSNHQTFIEAKSILSKLKKFGKKIFLIGNFCEQEIAISRDEVQKLCRKSNCDFIEMSALMGVGILYLMKVTKEALIK